MRIRVLNLNTWLWFNNDEFFGTSSEYFLSFLECSCIPPHTHTHMCVNPIINNLMYYLAFFAFHLFLQQTEKNYLTLFISHMLTRCVLKLIYGVHNQLNLSFLKQLFFFKICIDYYFSHFYERRNKNLILESSVMFKTMYKLFGGSCKSYKKIEGLFNEAIFPLRRA